VAGMQGANSTEFDLETPFPVIDLLPEQKEVADMGGTMRLGADPVKLHDSTRIRELYAEAVIYERHRHRYEVNNHLRRRLESAGLICSGTSPDERLVEAIELSRETHPFFVASQYHPEFKSRPERPAPLFREFVGAALAHEVVHVYLSRETGGSWDEGTSLYLGALKATNGSFNYELPATTDVASYRSVVVWCRAFRVLITWADLRAT